MKTKFIYAILAIAVLSIASCNRDEKNLFDKNPTERANEAMDNILNTLPAAPNGWDMVYFANPESEGYHVIVKFDKNGRAVVAAKNSKTTRNKFKMDSTSVWNVQLDYGPILTFDTYNQVMHAWADPQSDGNGFLGDYEFLILETTPNLIRLKGKKHAAYCYMRPLAKDVTWESYLDELSKHKTELVGNGNLLIYEENGVQKGMLFQVTRNSEKVFIQSSKVTGVFCLSPMDMPCEPEEGINVYPYENLKDGLQLQYGMGQNRKVVTYHETNDAFVADDGSRLVVGNLNLYAGRYIQFGGRSWSVNSTNGEMCPALTDARQRLETYLKKVSNKAALQGIFISYETSKSIYDADSVYVSIRYTSNGSNSNNVYFKYNMTYNENGMSLQYIGPKYTKNGQGQQVLDKFDGVKDILDAINGEYTMTTDNAINPANGSMLSKKGDPNMWLSVSGAL